MNRIPKPIQAILQDCALPHSTAISGKGRTVVTVGSERITIRARACRKGVELQNTIHRLKRAIQAQMQ